MRRSATSIFRVILVHARMVMFINDSPYDGLYSEQGTIKVGGCIHVFKEWLWPYMKVRNMQRLQRKYRPSASPASSSQPSVEDTIIIVVRYARNADETEDGASRRMLKHGDRCYYGDAVSLKAKQATAEAGLAVHPKGAAPYAYAKLRQNSSTLLIYTLVDNSNIKTKEFMDIGRL